MLIIISKLCLLISIAAMHQEARYLAAMNTFDIGTDVCPGISTVVLHPLFHRIQLKKIAVHRINGLQFLS
jgi:hypothetical protein